MVAKFQASDGVGLWGANMGGSANDYFRDTTMTPTGPVTVGYSQSPSVSVGAVFTTNLQRQAADPGDKGAYAMFVTQISSNDVVPSCLTCPSGGHLADATTNAGTCYVNDQCLDDGKFSTVKPCFRCDAGTSQTALTPVTDNHCFIDGKCVPDGEAAPYYEKYNSDRWAAPPTHPPLLAPTRYCHTASYKLTIVLAAARDRQRVRGMQRRCGSQHLVTQERLLSRPRLRREP